METTAQQAPVVRGLQESREVGSARFLAQRTTSGTAGNKTTALALQAARAQHLTMMQQRLQSAAANLSAAWQPLGPVAVTSATFGNLSGRVTAIALDPNDASGNTVYLGTTGGGVWRSTNAAGSLSSVSFAPLTDTLPVFAAGTSAIASLSIGAVAVQPAANPVVLVGTGDPNDASDSLYGEGLLRSGDGGLTWTLVQGSQDGVNGNHSYNGLATAGLAFSTATPTLVVAAMSTSAQGSQVGAANSASVPGLYYSVDAGQTWQMATLYDGAAVVQQPQPLGTGQVGNAATAVVWDAQRQRFYAAVRAHGYYSSADGVAWTRLAVQPGAGLTVANCPVGVNGSGGPNCPLFRGALAVQPTTGDLYALTVDANNLDQGLWQDLCALTAGACANAAPTFANRLDKGALEVGQGVAGASTVIQQGGYNQALAAAPSAGGGTVLFAGTVDLYRCALAASSASCALRNTTNALNGCNAPAAVAPSQHALAAVGVGGVPLLYVGNDGGLWRSTDGVAETGPACSATDASHFDNLNAAIGVGGSLAQVTGFAQHPTDGNTLLAGLGANGSAATTTAPQLAAWPQMSAGEGGYPAIDANTPTNWMLAIGAGVDLKQCTLGGGCTAANFVPPATVGEVQVSNDAALLDAPTLLDPGLTTNVLEGTCRVWRGVAADGSTWSSSNAISPAFDGSAVPCTANSPLVRSLAAGGPVKSVGAAQNSGSTVVYAGMAGVADGGGSVGGHLFVTTAANTANAAKPWTDTALPNAGGFDVSSVAVDPHDASGSTVYATVMGFGVPHVFRSVDFGAHWTNTSANLPNAPADAVVVDPNDANTVYVALDTGVYVTQQIGSCATTNCWSVLGTALPNAPVVALTAGAALPTGDGRHGMLRAATYGRGIWQTPLLTAVSPAQPALTVAPTGLTFAAQQVGTQSAAQTVTLTSSGTAAVTFGTPTITGDFVITANSCTGSLAVTAACTLQIAFAPGATGPRSGQLTVYANVTGGQLTVALSGSGTAPAAIVLTPLSLSFTATLVNQTTAAQTISVANTGGTAATLLTPIVSGDFAISANTCGASLAASTGCAISITFTPTSAGPRAGMLSLTDSAGTQTAQLSGMGNANATDALSAAGLSFGQQQIGTTSAAQQVTLTNSGDVALTLIVATLPSPEFAVVSACGNSLAGHSSCVFSVTFTPAATGARSATLTIADQFRSQTVALSGSGVAPAGVSLTPLALVFPATGVGLLAPAQTLTLTNNGGLPLTISSIAAGAGFVVASSTCTTALPAGAACAVVVVFAPTTPGAVAGALTLTDNAGGTASSQSVALSGTGVDFTLAANGPTSATVASGTSASYSLLLSSQAGLSGSVAISCGGAPTNSICSVSPGTGALGGSSVVAVTVQTGVAHVRLETPAPFRYGPQIGSVLLALLMPLVVRRRRGLRMLACGLMLGGTCMLFGCGAGRVNPDATLTPPATVTPGGTYNLTVTAASEGLTRSVGLTLVVR